MNIGADPPYLSRRPLNQQPERAATRDISPATLARLLPVTPYVRAE